MVLNSNPVGLCACNLTKFGVICRFYKCIPSSKWLMEILKITNAGINPCRTPLDMFFGFFFFLFNSEPLVEPLIMPVLSPLSTCILITNLILSHINSEYFFAVHSSWTGYTIDQMLFLSWLWAKHTFNVLYLYTNIVKHVSAFHMNLLIKFK